MLDEAKDPKTKIECMKLQMDLWKSVMSMATDGGIIERAMKTIKGLESKQENITNINSEKISESEQEHTTEDADIIEESEDIPTEAEEDIQEEE
jgi:hypothetical protein